MDKEQWLEPISIDDVPEELAAVYAAANPTRAVELVRRYPTAVIDISLAAPGQAAELAAVASDQGWAAAEELAAKVSLTVRRHLGPRGIGISDEDLLPGIAQGLALVRGATSPYKELILELIGDDLTRAFKAVVSIAKKDIALATEIARRCPDAFRLKD